MESLEKCLKIKARLKELTAKGAELEYPYPGKGKEPGPGNSKPGTGEDIPR